jgi:MFS family permease
VIVIVIAAGTDSGTTYLIGSIVGGLGFGAAFLGGLRALVAAIPPEHRAAVMSAFFVVAYGSLSVPAVLAGIVVTHLGLESTFEIFGSVRRGCGTDRGLRGLANPTRGRAKSAATSSTGGAAC